MDDVSFVHGVGAGTIVIGNCPAHLHIDGLQSVKLVFLPPNTTSRTQPMDQGIIANLKHHYLSILIKQLISAIDKHEPYVVSVLDAMRLIWQAWDLVKQSTIAHCFAHCHFKQQEDTCPESILDDKEEDLSLADLATHLRTTGFEVDGTLTDFIMADDQLATSEAITDKLILHTVKNPGTDTGK